jgi:hypothetical protein
LRALTRFAAAAAAAGALSGAVSRTGGAASPVRATAALFTAFGLATCLAAAANGPSSSLRGRVVVSGLVAALAFAAAWIVAAIAGEPLLFGACAVVAGAAVLAGGVASIVRARGASRVHATFAGAALPAALAGVVFVADPFVEWRGSETAEAPARSAAVIGASPLAAIAGDAGCDWQRSAWMYDGPARGTPGLSAVGRYYWSRPASPWAWALAAAAAGLAARAAARRRSTMAG